MLAAYTGMVVPLTAQRRAGSLDSLFPSLDDTLGALLIGTFVTLMYVCVDLAPLPMH